MATPPVEAGSSAPRRPRRLRRIVLLSVAAAVLVAASLVALLPTLVSAGLFRGSIIAAIEERVNGKVSIGSVELGWHGPIAVSGFTIDDPAGGNRIALDASCRQGLWTLLVDGTSVLDASIRGQVRARREDDGTISIARLSRDFAVPAAASSAPASPPPGASSARAGPPALPSSLRDIRIAIDALDVDVAGNGSAPSLAVRGAKGSAHVVVGGEASIELAASTELGGTPGAVSLRATAPGLFASDGSLRVAGTRADVDVTASGLPVAAAGMDVRIQSLTARIRSADLAGRVDADVELDASVAGERPCSVRATLAFDRLLSPDAGLVVDLAAIHGSVDAKAVPLGPFQRFVPVSGIDLARDVGASVDLEARFADASGGDISLAVRGGSLAVSAAGSVDPRSRAASFRTVDLTASLAPAMLEALADVSADAPARLSLRARDVTVPAAGPGGAFPTDDLRFDVDVTLAAEGLRVPGPAGRTPLGIAALRAHASAAPVRDGIDFSLDADEARAGGGPPLRAAGKAVRGGALGTHGALRVERLPTALVRPFLPSDLAVDLARDVGATVDLLEATVGAGPEPAVALRLASPHVDADLSGTLAADRAFRLGAPGAVSASPVSRGLLAHFGIDVDSDAAVSVALRRLALPPIDRMDVSAIELDADVKVLPAGAAPLGIAIGGDGSARRLAVADLSVAVRASPVGSTVSATAAGHVEGMSVRATASASGLGDRSRESVERAAYKVDAEVSGIASATLSREIPAAQPYLAHVGDGTFALKASYSGSLLDGTGSAAVTSAGVAVHANAVLTRESLALEGSAGADVAQALLAAAAPSMPGRLVAPARVELRLSRASMRRTLPWEFAMPAAVKGSVEVGRAELAGLPGVQGNLVLEPLAVEAECATAGRLAASGSVRGQAAARRGTFPAVPIAPIVARFRWQAGEGAQPASWGAEASLDGIRGDGLAALVDLDESTRKEIGSGARIAAKASGLGADGVAFEASSTLERLKAEAKGELRGGELAISSGSADLTLPPAQATALANALSPRADDGRAPAADAWKSVEAVSIRAQVSSLRMGLGGSPAPAAAGLRLPSGFAAVASATVAPFRMTASDGAVITVESTSASIDVPGLARPASVKASTAVAVQGGARAPVSLEATLRDWAAADGSIDHARMRVDGSVRSEGASTRAIGLVSGVHDLEEAVGPELTLTATVASPAAGNSDADIRLRSRFLQLDAPRLSLRQGTLKVEAANPVVAQFVPSPPLRKRWLAPINPVLRDIRLADERKPIRLTLQSLSLPIDGEMRALDGNARLVVGDVLLERNPDNDVLNLLKAFQGAGGGPVDGVIEPLDVTVRQGQLSYKGFKVGIERQGDGWRTRLIFGGDIDLASKPPFARAIAANYPLASVAREVVGLLPNEDGGGSVADVLNTISLGVGDAVQLRVAMRGPLGEVNGRPAKLDRKVKVVFEPKEMTKDIGKTVEKVGGLIDELIRKGKK